MNRLILLMGTLGLIVVLGGCGDDVPQTKPRAVRSRVAVKKKVVAKKVVVKKKKELPFVYQVENRRDPFMSLLQIRKPLADEAEPLTPLEKFGLKELKLCAVILGKGQPRAMVEAPDKKAYILTVGVKVGRNHGVVTQITTDGVTVEERFRDFAGKSRTETKVMTLPDGKGE